MGAQFTPPPPAAITRVLSRFNRDQLAGFVAVALDLMDLADGDLDAELTGDEQDASYPEWITLTRNQRLQPMPLQHEDAEEDDAAGQCDEDEANTLTRLVKYAGHGPGCTISDPDLEHDGREPPEYYS